MSVSKRGFSLVELSIVLVILGLLTGGILAGQSLIRAAELRSVSTQYQQIISAVQGFRDKYMALPGDMRNATSFWGTAANCPGTSAQGSTTPATCNGDGDGMIEPTTTVSNEVFRLWQQLANAGLIEGQYSGVTGGSANEYTGIASNALRGKINNSYWFSLNWGVPLTGDANWFSGEYIAAGAYAAVAASSTTCFDNANVNGAAYAYSVSNENGQNCAFSVAVTGR